jgi:quercetin dioxygenase-like cupin family protein
MDERVNKSGSSKRRLAGLLALLAAATLAVGVLPSAANHGVPHAVPLARGSFAHDDVGAKIKVKLDGRRTDVIDLKDASDLVFLEITIHDGAQAPWHTHSGPAFLVNNGPGTLTSILSDDCTPRHYGPGEALVDPGQGTLHAAFNDSGQDLVVYAVFLGVDNGPVLPTEPPADCELLP